MPHHTTRSPARCLPAVALIGLSLTACSDPSPDGPVHPTQIAAARDVACARMSDGTVRCWGRLLSANSLFERRRLQAHEAVVVPGLASVSHVSVGDGTVCALMLGGAVQCTSQIGFIARARLAADFSAVAGLNDVVQVSAGADHACARRASGALHCWGDNSCGQRGDAAITERTPPTQVPSLGAIGQVASGSVRTCAVTSRGSAICWGSNVGSCSEGRRGRPEALDVAGDVTQISVGASHACALTARNEVFCSGANSDGQLGFPAYESPSRPTLVGAAEVAVGADHSCARMMDSTVRCWGANDQGQLGTITRGEDQPDPTPVPSLVGVVELALGTGYSCARLADHSVRCWGFSFGSAPSGRIVGL